MRGRRSGAGVAFLKIEAFLDDGSLLARPAAGRGWTRRSAVRVLLPENDIWRRASPELGARFLARMSPVKNGDSVEEDSERASYKALRIIRRFSAERGGGGRRATRESPAFHAVLQQDEDGARLVPIDKKGGRPWSVSGGMAGAGAGDLVLARIKGRTAFIEKRLDFADAPRQWGRITIASRGLRDGFPEEALQEISLMERLVKDPKRENMTDLPFITIDPSDARDHDDAVCAAPDDHPDNKDGWRLWVAIADVAHYVRPDMALDDEARARGCSAYLADRVLPMLPPKLSNDLCSLRKDEERPVLCVSIRLSDEGVMKDWRFSRSLIRTRENLSYEAFQEERGDPSSPRQALWSAHEALERAREIREPLEIALPERKVVFGEGDAFRIEERALMDSHRLIENFMVAANVAAARSLQEAGAAAICRAHDQPAKAKKEEFARFLSSFSRRPSQKLDKPAHFNHILRSAKNDEEREILSLALLRAQSQAEYSRVKARHFGLRCDPYLHFTSPIRRYADLIAHRALIKALSLSGEGGMIYENEFLDDAALHLSEKERDHQFAEYDTLDRYAAAALAERRGEEFSARISCVTRAGLFARLAETRAEGLLPLRSLGDERFRFDPKRQEVRGQRSGRAFRAGQAVRVTLEEASPITGALRFSLSR